MKRLMILGVLAVCLLGSCDDFLTSRDRSQVLEGKLFTNREGVEDALYGIYTALAMENTYGVYIPQTMDLLAQFYEVNNSKLNDLLEYNHDKDVCGSRYAEIWKRMYKVISDINNFLDRLDSYDGKPLEFENLYRGEALGLRAYLHFDLLRMFGYVKPGERGIPYVKDFGVSVTPFSTVQEAYQFILDDLLVAEKLLAADKDNLSLPRVRTHEFVVLRNRELHFNLYAVKATLARVYCTRGEAGDMEKAGQYAREIIESGKFPLLKEVKDVAVMMAGVVAETEGIFGLSTTYVYSSLHNYFIEGGTNGLKPFWDNSINLYTGYKKLTDPSWVGPYDNRLDWFPLHNDNRVFMKLIDPVEYGSTTKAPAGEKGVNQIRVAEMYLIAAEACMVSDSETAKGYLDDLARARGLSEFLEELTLENLDKEWRRELVQEGQVWFRMKRRQLKEVASASSNLSEKITMTDDMWRLRIPEAEFETRIESMK